MEGLMPADSIVAWQLVLQTAAIRTSRKLKLLLFFFLFLFFPNFCIVPCN